MLVLTGTGVLLPGDMRAVFRCSSVELCRSVAVVEIVQHEELLDVEHPHDKAQRCGDRVVHEGDRLYEFEMGDPGNKRRGA